MRSAGVPAGVLAFVLDALKGGVASLVARAAGPGYESRRPWPPARPFWVTCSRSGSASGAARAWRPVPAPSLPLAPVGDRRRPGGSSSRPLAATPIRLPRARWSGAARLARSRPSPRGRLRLGHGPRGRRCRAGRRRHIATTCRVSLEGARAGLGAPQAMRLRRGRCRRLGNGPGASTSYAAVTPCDCGCARPTWSRSIAERRRNEPLPSRGRPCPRALAGDVSADEAVAGAEAVLVVVPSEFCRAHLPRSWPLLVARDRRSSRRPRASRSTRSAA